ncbi:MAG TPA: hypothetical protein VK861_11515 [Bacteroidales bacterium]|nr:hypothetical protein [Bacteroidales bacterium]
MGTPKNNSAKIIVPLIIIGIGMALLLVLIPGDPETTTDQQFSNTEIRDWNQFIPDDEYDQQIDKEAKSEESENINKEDMQRKLEELELKSKKN